MRLFLKFFAALGLPLICLGSIPKSQVNLVPPNHQTIQTGSGGGAEQMLQMTKIPESISNPKKDKSVTFYTECKGTNGKTIKSGEKGFEECLSKSEQNTNPLKGEPSKSIPAVGFTVVK